ncbi:MAG TPA: hypothetical protein VN761_00720 [Candidatus Polarisedimenticolia bacterium]|nr:hypothetical protein [Candidatus Polarisedimenticolia bacterium]
MTQPVFLYVVNWFLIFVLSTRSGEVLKRRLKEDVLPEWFRGRKATALAYLAGVIVMGSSVSSVIFGILFMRWYVWPLALFGGMAITGVTFKNFSAASVVAFWPPFLILVQVILWVFGRSHAGIHSIAY